MRYFCEGKEISEAEMEKIVDDNQRYMESGTLEDMAKCKYIEVVGTKGDVNRDGSTDTEIGLGVSGESEAD